MLSLSDVALFRLFPALRDQVPWVRLGGWPTPVELLAGPADGARVAVYVKREDLSSPRYGGNKVRTLEAMMGRARAAGARRIWATGAYGSNHAIATVLHAEAAELQAGVALFPQPPSTPARANLGAVLSQRPLLRPMCHAVELPLAMAALRRRDRDAFVMTPGGATPQGALGALSAALELAEQVAAGVCPAPARIVLPVGSACTSAGLLAGLHLASALGIGFAGATRVPKVTAVRVTPWPVSSPLRIAHLAWRTSRYLSSLTGAPPASFAALYHILTVDPRFFGGGYGRATATGYRATVAFRDAGGPPLDVVYSAKAGAALLALARDPEARGPLLFWATKSSAPLPEAAAEDVASAPRAWRRWLT
jgi:D-cysteine desulfhydrase